MASKDRIHERRNLMIKSLNENPDGLSYEDIALICDAKKRTINADIAELRKQGFEIVVQNNIICLSNTSEEKSVMRKSDNAVIRQMITIREIQKRPGYFNKHSLWKYIRDIAKENILLEEECEEEYIEKKLDARRKAFDEDLKALEKKRYISISESGYLNTTIKTPFINTLRDKEIVSVFEDITYTKSGEVYSTVADSLRKKLADNIVNKLYGENKNEGLPVMSFNVKEYKNLDAVMNLLAEVDYKARKIDVIYRTKEGKEILRKVAVGALVFSSEREKIYLLGKEHWDESVCNTILNVENIISVKETDESNNVYGDEEFKNIVSEMFIVSVEEPQDVEVWFDNKFNIKEKIERLHIERKFSKIRYEEDKIMYTDRIRGMEDFARYLRGYGYSCKVIKPESLRVLMKNSAEKLIEIYTELLEGKECEQ